MTSSYVNGVTTTYAYRADGLRKSKTANGVITRHVWDGDQIVQDLNGIDLVREYVRGIRLIDTYSPASPERIAYIQNARGDVVGHVNDLTTVIDFVDYDAFGNLDTGVLSDPLAYCGEYLDFETGFIYLRARYYDPSIGRFTTEDPARDGLNWYVYCNNNPVNFVDPSGLEYVELRALVEMLGGTIEWDSETKTAAVTIGQQTGSFTHNGNFFAEGNTDPFIYESKMYVDDIQFYEQFGAIAYQYDFGDKTQSGKVLIVNQTINWKQFDSSVLESDFLVIDYRRRKEGNPAMEVLSCYKANSNEQRYSVIDVLLQFEQRDPTGWARTRDSLEDEWWRHQSVVWVGGYIAEKGKDAMLDNNAEVWLW